VCNITNRYPFVANEGQSRSNIIDAQAGETIYTIPVELDVIAEQLSANYDGGGTSESTYYVSLDDGGGTSEPTHYASLDDARHMYVVILIGKLLLALLNPNFLLKVYPFEVVCVNIHSGTQLLRQISRGHGMEH
jgi:hypothetical protein